MNRIDGADLHTVAVGDDCWDVGGSQLNLLNGQRSTKHVQHTSQQNPQERQHYSTRRNFVISHNQNRLSAKHKVSFAKFLLHCYKRIRFDDLSQ